MIVSWHVVAIASVTKVDYQNKVFPIYFMSDLTDFNQFVRYYPLEIDSSSPEREK